MKSKDIGIVSTIAAPTRFMVHIKGHAAHSGTTPMEYRRDAFLSASELALDLEKAAKEEKSYGTVATVWEAQIFPGAMNIIPGEVTMKIDIRSTSMESKERVVQKIFLYINRVKLKRNVTIDCTMCSDEESIRLNEIVSKSFVDICDSQQFSYVMMSSGGVMMQ